MNLLNKGFQDLACQIYNFPNIYFFKICHAKFWLSQILNFQDLAYCVSNVEFSRFSMPNFEFAKNWRLACQILILPKIEDLACQILNVPKIEDLACQILNLPKLKIWHAKFWIYQKLKIWICQILNFQDLAYQVLNV